ncbi:thiamine pyrophosphate-dependent enzyme [Dankookia sp. GCM10030260]|uniref:thiamine pyrophosphate-dependent enzyme n=1 Tax=Dankookia sp. GCM10030260 TaxID=3273390 RepID=UPI0036170B22
MSKTVGRALAESLVAHGIDTIWMVPGESFLGLTDALTEVPEMRLIVCRHEGGAGFMAVADGRMQGGRAGVLLVSRGPGLSNAMVALHTAWHDATPLVVLCGQVERKDFGRLALQEQNYAKLLGDITKAVIEVNEVVQASESIARAFHLAESGTPGPVAVILPEDIFDELTDTPMAKPRPRVHGGPRAEDLDQLAKMLAEAERPLVWVGGALTNADATTLDELRRLAEQWVVPVSPTHRRPQLFDAGHPNYGGYMGIRVPKQLMDEMRKADLLVVIGERITDSVSQSYTFPTAPDPQLPLVQVWPDPNEIGRVFRPDLGIAAEPAAVIRALLKRGAPAGASKRTSWVAGLNAIHTKLMAPDWESMADGVNFAAVCVEIAKHLAPDAAVTSDAGNFSSFIHRYIGFRPGQNFLSSVVGAMGAGVPMAVAAAIRRPGKQAIGFCGDGGALMSGNEIATAMQYGAAPIIVISDNKRYGTIGMHHEVRYPNRPYEAAVKLTNPDFAAWGRVFGAEGITISTEAEVEDAIARAFAVKDRPVVVHVHTSAEQMSAWRRRGAPRVHE